MTITSSVTTKNVLLRSDTGEALGLPGQRWVDRADTVDEEVLGHVEGPVVDLGCGPGRHVEALAQRGVVVLGIDLSAHAVSSARRKHLAVLQRSIFDVIPKAGHWNTALLMDGNIGIGGDPERLLTRVRALVRPGGLVVVETHCVKTAAPVKRVRLEINGVVGPWFDWAHVTADHLPDLVQRCGLRTRKAWTKDDRSFALLGTPSE